MASLRREEGIPNMVLIGLPSLASLKRAEAKLQANAIPHYAWVEPDYDFGFTAIATAPLNGEQRKVMANYRVYNASVAQLRERPALNGEAVGANPTRSANAGGTAASAVLS
jgi:hypothetical protein